MDELQIARQKIDTIDKEMAVLFERRMKAVESVANYKQLHGLPIFDRSREDAVVEKNSQRVSEELRPYYVEFLRDTMKASRHYQRQCLEGMRVAYSGIEGAYAHIAASRIYPDAIKVAYTDFASAYRAVEEGECDVAVLPIENSTAGEVDAVVDLMFSGTLNVTESYDLAIQHSLMALPGVTLDDIKTVISHPQALSQCAAFLQEGGFALRQAGNTAVAAKSILERGDRTVAAIASEETASIYGLKVLKKSISETVVNTTRFAVFSRGTLAGKPGRRTHIVMFTVRNEAGCLARALNVIGEYGYNMNCLRSRPLKELLWQYYFYAEIEGDLTTENGKAMLTALGDYCEQVKIAGSFR